MSKADKMFEELGLRELKVYPSVMFIYQGDMYDDMSPDYQVSFYVDTKTFWVSNNTPIGIDLYNAITQQMKELGWI